MILFFKVFLTEFIAEMGDKTQLMLIALTSKYKLRDIILGTAAAILVLNGLAGGGGLFSPAGSSANSFPAGSSRSLPRLHFFILPHQHLRAMMTRKRKAAANPGSGSHRLQFSVPFS